MERSLLPVYALGSALFTYAAAATVALYMVWSLVELARGHSIRQVRLLLARGMVAGLSLTAAATLLRLLMARSWHDVAMIAVLLTLRTGLKQALVWEERRLAPTSPSAPPPAG